MNTWRILVPTRIGKKRIKFSHHKKFDEFVLRSVGGLTVYRGSKGYWTAATGEVFRERMIPVDITCSENQINIIADFIAVHYAQKAVYFYLVSENSFINHY